MTTVDREELLKQLESVSPGLSPREIIEQSSCFVFQKGRVVTFNDEVACWTKTAVPQTGAVQSKLLLGILRKMPDESIDVGISDGKFIIKGKKRMARIPIEEKITLPFKAVEDPKEWKKLPPDFLDAINLVHRCGGPDQQKMEKYVHLHPQRIEACMEHQVGCFKTQLPLAKAVLVHRDSVKHVVGLGMTQFGITKNWLHFRNPTGLVMCCRRWVEEDDYPDTSKALSVQGVKITLPKGLAAAAERASVFSAENPDDDDIVIVLQPGHLTVLGKGINNADYREGPKSIQYTGKSMTFTISPKLLAEITSKHNEAWITPKTLKVRLGKFTYITSLGTVEKKEQPEEEHEEE
jgi:hypothetical protein